MIFPAECNRYNNSRRVDGKQSTLGAVPNLRIHVYVCLGVLNVAAK